MLFNNLNIKKSLKHESSVGFSLIEIVIAIFLLSFALIVIFSAFSMIVILTSDTADRLVATYLAQEGMEIVRNVRDANWLNMDVEAASGATGTYSWVDGLTGAGIRYGVNCQCENPENCNGGCYADYTSTSMAPIAAGALLKIDSAGFYNNTIGSDTKFKRKIIINPVEDVDGKSDHIIKVIVQVSWKQKATILNDGVEASVCGDSNCVETKGTLYNWYNYKGYTGQ